MSDPEANCNICLNYYKHWSETGKGNMIQKCQKDQEDGVAQVGTVYHESDCPYFKRINLATPAGVYPKRMIKTSADSKPIISSEPIDTTINPYEEVAPKYPKRGADR